MENIMKGFNQFLNYCPLAIVAMAVYAQDSHCYYHMLLVWGREYIAIMENGYSCSIWTWLLAFGATKWMDPRLVPIEVANAVTLERHCDLITCPKNACRVSKCSSWPCEARPRPRYARSSLWQATVGYFFYYRKSLYRSILSVLL